MKKRLQRVVLYSYMHIAIHSVLSSYFVNYEHLGDKLLLNNENSSTNECKVLGVIRNSGGTGQRQNKDKKGGKNLNTRCCTIKVIQ